MQKNAKFRFIKNRAWKSRFLHRLKGRPEDVCADYVNGLLDRLNLIRIRKAAKPK